MNDPNIIHEMRTMQASLALAQRELEINVTVLADARGLIDTLLATIGAALDLHAPCHDPQSFGLTCHVDHDVYTTPVCRTCIDLGHVLHPHPCPTTRVLTQLATRKDPS